MTCIHFLSHGNKLCLKWKLYSITIFRLHVTQKISALIKGCCWKLLILIKLQHCLVFLLVFCWSIQSQVRGMGSEGRNNYFLGCSYNEKNWRGFPLGRLLESSPSFIWIFMVEAFGWWRGLQEKAGLTEWSAPQWKALELSSQGAPWAAFVVGCNKSFMCRPLDLLVVWTRPLSLGGGHCVWRQFKELGLTWWARPIPP